MKNTFLILFVSTFLGFIFLQCSITQQTAAEPIVDKNSLIQADSTPVAPLVYRRLCFTCHTRVKDVGSGPSLIDLMKNVPNEKWVSQFVLNEESLIQAKDPYTIKVNQWSKNIQYLHAFGTPGKRFISQPEMDSILVFLK